MGRIWQQTRLLLWKNFVLKKRHPVSTLSEFLLPLAFVLLVVWLQTLDPDKDLQEQHYTCPRESSLSPSLLFPTNPDEHREFILELETDGFGPGLATVPPFIYLSMIASKLQYIIALAPGNASDPELTRWLEDFQSTLDSWTTALEASPVWKQISNNLYRVFGFGLCRFKSISKIYPSYDSLNEYVKSDDYGSTTWPSGEFCPSDESLEKPKIHMALILNKVGYEDQVWDYTIQTNFTVTPFTYPKLGFTNTIESGVNEKYIDMYMMSGFLTLQQTVDRLIMNKTVSASKEWVENLAIRQLCDTLAPLLRHLNSLFPRNGSKWDPWHDHSVDSTPPLSYFESYSKKGENCQTLLKRGVNITDLTPLTEPVRYLPNDVRMTEFPTPTYTDRPFYEKIKDVFALDLILTFLWPISRLIRGIVHEKETLLREGMRMMGLQYSALYLSWFLTYGFIFTVISLSITLITHSGLFIESDPSLVFLYFFLFGISIVAYCFVVSVLFNRAKTASTAGVVLFFMGFFAYFGVNSQNANAPSKLFGSILSPTAFGIGASILASYEGAGSGVTWGNMHSTPNESQIAFATVLGMLLFDTLLYIFLAFYLDSVLPHEFGISRPWNFLFTKKYWFPDESTSHGEDLVDEEQAHADEDPNVHHYIESPSVDLKQLEREGRCVKLRGLRKEFETASGEIRVAVNSLNLTMYEGQIFVLLGHNGAGKSTTIKLLTGLIGKTAGKASIYGNDTGEDMETIRQSLGVCPQHDVLFPELTVEEHLEFFANLKSVKNVKEEIKRHLIQVGLVDKRHTLAGNLSGGQKRKLSVCIALLGDSRIVFLDEPTSGMDAYSRRSTWNMLQKNRSGRVIVLTTHFMDEADLLGDRIAIMADGNLKCCGTSLFLKERYGIGYTITFALEVPSQADRHKGSENGTGSNPTIGSQLEDRKKITNVVQSYISEAVVLSSVGAEISFKVPFSASECFPKLFSYMEEQKHSLHIANYGVSVTQLEEVFLKVASDEFNHQHQLQQGTEVHNTNGSELVSEGTNHSSYRRQGDEMERDALTSQDRDEIDKLYATTYPSAKFSIQFRALFLKRMHYAKRDNKSLCCNTLLPVLLLLLGLSLMKAFPMKEPPSLLLNTDKFDQPVNFFPINVSITSSSTLGKFHFDDFAPGAVSLPAYIQEGLNNSCPKGIVDDNIFDGSQLRGFSQWLLDHRKDNQTSVYGGAFFSSVDPEEGVVVTIFSNSTAKHGPGVFLNLVNEGLLRGLTPNLPEEAAKPKIRVRNHPFPFTSGFVDLLDSFGSIDASMSIVIAFSFVPASVAIFIVKEKEISAKHQQLISGASILAYWVSSYVWDMLMYLVPWFCSILLIWAFNISAFQGSNFFAVVVLFFLYGLSTIPFTYCVSFLFTSHSTAQNVVLLLNFITGLILLIASFVMMAIESTYKVNRVLQYLYRLFPGFCLGNGLLRLTLNKSKKDFLPFDEASSSPFDWDVAGAEMTYLFGTSIVYFFITLMIDLFFSFPWLRANGWKGIFQLCRLGAIRGSTTPSDPLVDRLLQNEEGAEDEDVIKERDRVDQGTAENDVIVLKHLRKIYGDGKIAVRGLTFGIPEGECFGFLGQNGAGKTSTMKILTGDILPSSGTAQLVGNDILFEQSELRRMIGYCPQFDALLEHLTVREHLELYARIKCVPERLVPKVATEKIRELNLDDFEHKTAGTLSGGNKRKLSIAIAMVGAPPLVFCDEPTSGMDPFNRRFLWDVISRLSTESERSRKGTVVLTSHSMEECEALCSKVGILVGGQFSCFGSIQHLKSRFGNGLMVNVKLCLPVLEKAETMLKKIAHLIPAGASGGIPVNKIEEVCSIWGNRERWERATAPNSVLGSIIQKSTVVDGLYFAEWWLTEDDFDTVETFFNERFPGCSLVERHHTQGRFKLANRDIPGVFATLENAKDIIPISQYAVSDPTLEMIFNAFAQQQEEGMRNDEA